MTSSLNGKRLLVAGGAGFMGSNFVRSVLEMYPASHITNVDALTYAANLENLSGVDESRYAFVQGDICDSELMQRLMQDANIVVNFAAETHVDRSIHEGAAAFICTNVMGVHSLLEALRQSPHIERMVQISTDEVFGDLPIGSIERFADDAPFRPNSPYAASKASGDLLIRSFVRSYGLPVIITHAANNYGPRQFPEKLIPYFTMRALSDQPLPLYGTGENMRDWLYVDDHTSAVCRAIEKGVLGESYNISQEKEFSNKEIARRILRMLGKPESLITYVADRPGHDAKYASDSSKIRALGWKPLHSLETKLPETIAWYQKYGSASAIANANPHVRIES